MRVKVVFSIFALVAVVVFAAVAAAGKIGNGSSVGSAQVFVPNPVQSLGDESLTDQKDSDAAVPAAGYHAVRLTNLDGSGFLRGDYANVYSSTGNPAFSPTNTFAYTRHQDEFEQVMAYYWMTEAQKYIHSLGFGSSLPPINNEPQDARINQLGADNSFETDHPKDELRFGKGGVDDAEDAEVIVHEYGHSVQDAQVSGFGTSADAGAIGEGFGDYLAVAVSSAVAPTPDEACVADWDSTSYTVTVPHCLRRVDGTKRYPEDLASPREVHADGEIWSGALWDIRQALGARLADTIIICAQFGFTPAISMPAAARQTIATAALYGKPAQKAVTAAFAARGLA